MFPPRPELIAEVRTGMRVTVRGRVVPRDLMDSPLSSERCVYYRHAIEQWRQSRVAGVGGDGFWEIVEQDEAILEFYVEDDSGRAIAAPENARLVGGRKAGDDIVDIALHRRGRQLLLQPGDLVEVTGEAGLVDDLFDESRSYRSSPRRLILRAPRGGHLDIRLIAKAA